MRNFIPVQNQLALYKTLESRGWGAYHDPSFKGEVLPEIPAHDFIEWDLYWLFPQFGSGSYGTIVNTMENIQSYMRSMVHCMIGNTTRDDFFAAIIDQILGNKEFERMSEADIPKATVPMEDPYLLNARSFPVGFLPGTGYVFSLPDTMLVPYHDFFKKLDHLPDPRKE